jgi:hypothetical protein
MNDHLVIYNRQTLQSEISLRSGESKLGQHLSKPFIKKPPDKLNAAAG